MFHIALLALPETRSYFQSHWHPGSDADGQCCTMLRYGNAGDGGKMLCDSDLSETSNLPVLVSVGSNNEFSFEIAMHKRYPQMETHVFDGTVASPRNPPFITYHNTNLDSTTVHALRRFETYILKIDCEGCEYDVFKYIDTQNILQILVEVHGDKRSMTELDKLMRSLHTTHSVFYAEPNIEYSDGNCIEFSMRLRQMYKPLRMPHNK